MKKLPFRIPQRPSLFAPSKEEQAKQRNELAKARSTWLGRAIGKIVRLADSTEYEIQRDGSWRKVRAKGGGA
jgi:hypothetical protein